MTVEEIKEHVSMRDVLSKYGIQVNRTGMCSCPFHGRDRHPSMKVFKDGYNCFTCHANGDVFSFVQTIEKCSFKDAFISLGGTYSHSENKVLNKIKQDRFDRNRAQRNKEKDIENEFRKILEQGIEDCHYLINFSLLFSDEWCFAQNMLPILQDAWDFKYLEGNEVNKADVLRNCKRLASFRHS